MGAPITDHDAFRARMARTFVEGKTFRKWGVEHVCLERWFNGALELVKIAPALAAGEERHVRCITIHTARAASAGTSITETLGGVFRADMCRHETDMAGKLQRVIANAGPFAGRECCGLCGGALDMTTEERARCAEACDRRAATPGCHDLARHP